MAVITTAARSYRGQRGNRRRRPGRRMAVPRLSVQRKYVRRPASRASSGEALPVQGAFVVRIRALDEEIGERGLHRHRGTRHGSVQGLGRADGLGERRGRHRRCRGRRRRQLRLSFRLVDALDLIVLVVRPFPLIIEVLRKRSLQRRRRWRLQRQRQFVLMRVWHDRKRYQSAEDDARRDADAPAEAPCYTADANRGACAAACASRTTYPAPAILESSIRSTVRPASSCESRPPSPRTWSAASTAQPAR